MQLMAFGNSAWNPYLYCIFSKNFRNGFKSLICLNICKTKLIRSKEESTKSSCATKAIAVVSNRISDFDLSHMNIRSVNEGMEKPAWTELITDDKNV